MNFRYSFPGRLLRICQALLLGGLLASAASAQTTTLTLSQSADVTHASINYGQVVTFRISYAVASTSVNADGAHFTYSLDPKFDLVGMQKSPHVATTSYDNATRMGRFDFINPLPAGISGEISVQVRFRADTAENAEAYFQSSLRANNAKTVQGDKLTVTGINSGNSLVFKKGMFLEKYGGSTISANAPYFDYSIRHGNPGAAGDNILNYSVEDVFPPGTMLNLFISDSWANTNNAVKVSYRTNLNTAWRVWGANPLYRTGDGGAYHFPGEVPLLPTEYITGLKTEYGTLPGGGSYHPDRMRNSLYIRLSFVPSLPRPATVKNCALASAPSQTPLEGCAFSTVVPATPNFYLWSGYNGPNPLGMGDTVNLHGHLGQYPDSNADIVNPVLMFLLPPEIEYLGNFILEGYVWEGSGKKAPVFDRTDNYKGTGSTLLRWRWTDANPLTIKAIHDYCELSFRFDARVRPGTVNGYYTFHLYTSFTSPTNNTSGYLSQDLSDMDADGSTTDQLMASAPSILVQTNGGLASLASTMEVKGELDTAWSKFPATGQTVPSGKADYRIAITNDGGVIMKDPVLIDILPALNDRGVIDTSKRNSQWEPFLAGEVTAPAGLTVFYSKSKNPCRNELTPGIPAGCEDPKWSPLPPTDITLVKSLKFDGTGLNLRPLDRVEISWPMRAPLTAPTTGEIAWNSFGVIAKRQDDSRPTLPTEPVKTGITVKPPDPPYYGDRVWFDSNKNGVQDSVEKGLNGVRVELYRDNGDKVSDPLTDSLVTFTVTSASASGDGYYRFGNIGTGDYFAVIVPPDDYAVTPPDAGGNDSLDSDGKPYLHRNRRAALLPVTHLDPLEEDLTWDLGLYDRSGVPAVWTVATQPDGRILIGGKFIANHGLARNNIARIQPNGTPDPSFNPGTGFDGTVRSLAIRPDGLVWVGGNFANFNGLPTQGVALLNPAGAMAMPTLQPDTSDITWVGVRGATMFAAGTFNKFGGQPCGNIAALKSDGTPEPGFATFPGANAGINGGAVLSDGGLILVGTFTSYNGFVRNRVVKLKADGTVDPAFDPCGGANGEVFSVKLIEDGRLVLTGAFTNFAGTPCNGTIRLLPTGKCDPTLSPSTLAVKSINTSN